MMSGRAPFARCLSLAPTAYRRAPKTNWFRGLGFGGVERVVGIGLEDAGLLVGAAARRLGL